MELWASGFNAWSQLQFDGDMVAEPQDLKEFTCVLKDEHIEVLRASLSATLGKSPVLSFHIFIEPLLNLRLTFLQVERDRETNFSNSHQIT